MTEKKEKDMYFVTIGCERAKFDTLTEAKAFAEKESWLQNLMAEIRTPEGKTVKVKVGNVP